MTDICPDGHGDKGCLDYEAVYDEVSNALVVQYCQGVGEAHCTDMQLMSETTTALELGRMLTSLAYNARDNSMSAERGHKRQRSSIIPDSVVRPDRTHALLNLGATSSTHAAQLTL